MMWCNLRLVDLCLFLHASHDEDDVEGFQFKNPSNVHDDVLVVPADDHNDDDDVDSFVDDEWLPTAPSYTSCDKTLQLMCLVSVFSLYFDYYSCRRQFWFRGREVLHMMMMMCQLMLMYAWLCLPPSPLTLITIFFWFLIWFLSEHSFHLNLLLFFLSSSSSWCFCRFSPHHPFLLFSSEWSWRTFLVSFPSKLAFHFSPSRNDDGSNIQSILMLNFVTLPFRSYICHLFLHHVMLCWNDVVRFTTAGMRGKMPIKS